MASFQSFLHVGGKKYEILYSDLFLGQSVDALGRPSSPTLGGIFTIELNMPGSDDPTLIDWMVSPTKILSGKVVLKRLDTNATLKVIKFYNAYCVGMDISFDGTANASFFKVTVRISPEQIDIGGLFHDNKWPDESPIHEIADEDEVIKHSPVDEVKAPSAKEKKQEPGWFSEVAHGVLDVVGMIPVVGELADGANALLYVAEGDYANAAMSAAAMIPLAGNVVGAAKLAKRGAKLLGKAKKLVPPRLLKKLDEGIALAKRTLAKDPVDVATGMMLTQRTDMELPGPVPFVWERVWYSASDRRGPLGYGWHHRYDMGLTVDADTGIIVLRGGDGRQIAFDTSSVAGQPVLDRASGLTLYPPAPDDLAGMPWRIWDQALRVWYVFASPAPNSLHQPVYAVANTLGQRIQFSYGERGRLETITDSAGRLLTLNYNEQGLIEGLYGPHPDQTDERIRLAGYQHNAVGDLITYTDAEGNQWQYRYEQHLLVQTTLPTGLSFYWEYDGEGIDAQCVHTWGDGNIHEGRFEYVDATTTLMTDSDGTTRYTHRGGLITRKVNALGGEWQYTYNTFDELVAETDPMGATTRYGYDEGGNRLWTHYPDGSQITTAFDDQDQVVGYTDARGNTWHYEYNERGLQCRQIDPLGAITEYAFDEPGRLVTVVNTLGQPTQLRYDDQHQVVHIITPDEQIRSRRYDAMGRVVTLTDPTGAEQQRDYDRLGQLIRLTETDGSVQELVYDGEGNVCEARQGERVVYFTYVGAGRLAERRQADEHVRFSYDREGQLVGLTNEAEEQYRFELDGLGQVVTETGFDGLTRHYEYDAAGQVTKVLRPGGRTTSYRYDAGGRVSDVVYSDGYTEHYGYDAEGDLLEAVNALTTVVLTRDPMGRISQERQGQHVVDYQYNALGQRTEVNSSMGASLTLDYDTLGNVAQMQNDGWRGRFDYDSRGLEVQRQLSGGVRSQWTYTSLGRPISQLTRQGSVVRQRTYQWGQEDQLMKIGDSLFDESRYDYDQRGNLIGAIYQNGLPETRIADAVGNLFELANRSDRRYKPGGQLLTAGANQYTYDDEGNLTGKVTPQGEWQYRWNGAGLLQEVIRPDGNSVQFGYDALGRRVSKTYKGRVTRWVWDGDKPLHEWQELVLDGQNTDEVITWLFDEDSFAPVARLQGRQRYSIVTDHLGTPLEMIDQAGFTQWSAQTTTYGRVRLTTGTRADCPFRFQGQYEDTETGLYYNRFRYYAPEEGIYISQDPIGLAGGSALYAYVGDTNQYVDVLGLSAGSTALDKVLGGIVGDGKMAHHLIPELTWNANETFLQKIGIPGSMRDAATNGILITSTRPAPIPGKRTQIYHSTRHRNYTRMVQTKLTAIETRFNAAAITDVQAKQQVEFLQRSLRNKIQKATISTKLPCGRLS